MPLVQRQLERRDSEDPRLPRLRGMYRRNWYLNRLRLARHTPALEAIEQAGADPIIVASWELPALFYGDFGLRRIDSLQVLIRPERVEQAARAVSDAGWEVQLEAPQSRLRTRPVVRFTKEGDECLMHLTPLHQFTNPGRGVEPLDLWEPAVDFSLDGAPGRALSPADELLYVCLVGARTVRWPSIVWIADAMTVIAGSQIDWSRLVLQAERLRANLRLRDALLFLRDELDAPVPDEVLCDLVGAQVHPRELLAHRAEGARWRLLGGPPESVTRFLRITANQPLGAALASLPAFLRDEWGLERKSQLPLAAVRKAGGRLVEVLRERGQRPSEPMRQSGEASAA
jgi:hypothetical protein